MAEANDVYGSIYQNLIDCRRTMRIRRIRQSLLRDTLGQ